MKDVLFSISDLICSYDQRPESKILKIESLIIPKGKLVFLLGASGCGKSTLLETLGLMNNTIASGLVLLNTVEGQAPINLTDLWKDNKGDQLTTVRKSFYSFIFQNTNLMENFTAYENVCLSGMIKKNVPQSAILPEARTLMEKIKLPESEVNLQTLAVNLSGGQKQRLAFARALTNDASILFGDEPTGNLDEANANELFEIIRQNIDMQLSAIVVSHDINLAVKYADQIIVITKEKGKSYGEIKKENVFDRLSWEGNGDEYINSFKAKLREFYQTGTEHRIAKKAAQEVKVDTSAKYKKLFLRKEGKMLLGKQLANFFILSLILTFTFLAIGFANGCLDYLNKKVMDPFVNWMPISIPSSQSEKMEALLEDLAMPEIKTMYKIKNATPYRRSALKVWDVNAKKFVFAMGRTVDVDEDAEMILEFVLGNGNVIKSKLNAGFKDANDIGVIVTKNFLDEFGYPEDANTIYCQFASKDTLTKTMHDMPAQVPVRAIVNILPGKYKIIYPKFVYQSLIMGDDNIFDSTARRNNYWLFLETDDLKEASIFKKSLESFFSSYKEILPFKPRTPIFQNGYTLGFKSGYRYDIGFDSAINNEPLLSSLIHKIKANAEGIDSSNITRFFDYSGINDYLKTFKYDDLSIYFDGLDSVGAFKKYIYDMADSKNKTDFIQLDDAKVKDKQNFFFLSSVTKIISLLLVIFSTLAVCLFIFNLLRSHLSKVKMNIGTFKAIGLTDRESRNIYFQIVLLFVSGAMFFSILIATLIGKSINFFLSSSQDVLENISYFKIVDLSDKYSSVNTITLISIVVILLSTILMSRKTISKILNKTPGDLIYNR